MKVSWFRKIVIATIVLLFAISPYAEAQECSEKLFSVTINSDLTIGEAIENLAERCGLTVVVKDSGAQYRMKKNLYFIKL